MLTGPVLMEQSYLILVLTLEYDSDTSDWEVDSLLLHTFCFHISLLIHVLSQERKFLFFLSDTVLSFSVDLRKQYTT